MRCGESGAETQSHHHPPAQGLLRRAHPPDLIVPQDWGGQARLLGGLGGVLHLLGCSPALHKAVPPHSGLSPNVPLRGPLLFPLHHPLNFWGALVSTRSSRSVRVLSPQGQDLIFLCTAKSRPAPTPGAASPTLVVTRGCTRCADRPVRNPERPPPWPCAIWGPGLLACQELPLPSGLSGQLHV